MTRPPRTYQLARIALGFTAWAIFFLLIYGTQAIGCRLGWDRIDVLGGLSLQRAMQISLYFAGLAAAVLISATLRTEPSRRERDPTAAFLETVSVYAALAACGAVTLSFIGVFWLTLC